MRWQTLHPGWWIFCLVFFGFAGDVFAQPRAQGTVIYAEGWEANALRDDLQAVLPAGEKSLDAKPLLAALRAEKSYKPPLGKSLDSSRERSAITPSVRRALGSIGARSAVLAYAHKGRGGKVTLSLLVVQTNEEAPLITTDLGNLPKEQDARRRALTDALAPATNALAPASTTETSKNVAVAEEKSAKKDTAAMNPATAPPPTTVNNEKATATVGHGFTEGWLIARVEVGTIGRHFSYQTPRTNNLRPYDLLAAPQARLGIEFYPLALAGTPIVRDIGLWGSYERAFLLRSTTPDGASVTTSSYDWKLGLRGRIHLGPTARAPVIGIEGSYGMTVFSFSQSSAIAADEPSVRYRGFRFGFDGRFDLGTPALLVGAAYLAPTDLGPLKDRFPGSSTFGFDVFGGIALPLGPQLEGRISLLYARYFYSLSSQPNAPYNAEGATDQYYGLRLGIAFSP